MRRKRHENETDIRNRDRGGGVWTDVKEPVAPLRAILDWEFRQSKYSRHGYGSIRLKLECGHIDIRKASQNPKLNRVRCKDCLVQKRAGVKRWKGR